MNTDTTVQKSDNRKEVNKIKRARTVFIIIFMAWPVLQWIVFYLCMNIGSIAMAFQRTRPGTDIKEWSFYNFERMFREGFTGESKLLVEATLNTLAFFGFSFFILQPLNIIVGYFFYKKMPAYKIFRFIFYLPAIIPGTILPTLFRHIVSPTSSGLLSSVVSLWGGTIPNLLGSSEYAMKTMLLYNAWTGFTGFLLTSNAMKRIPSEIVESAQLDGITPMREITDILAPLIWPTIATGLLMGVMSIFTSSGPILFFTQGRYGTYTVAYWLYERVLTGTDMEYASSVGMFYTLLGFPLLAVTRWLSSKVEDVEY